jgi:hypothetical protein
MPHITLPEGVPGPRGPMLFRPEVAPPMSELAEVLMRSPSTLTLAERELIGTYGRVRNERLWWASPIVFGPRTLVRAWGTRTELWRPQQAWGKACGIPHLAKNERDVGTRRLVTG